MKARQNLKEIQAGIGGYEMEKSNSSEIVRINESATPL